MTLCSIVIPVFNMAELTKQCLDRLLAEPPRAGQAEIVVVDDCSKDETPALLQSYGERIRVVRHEQNRGFAHSCNDGAAAATGAFLVLLNNDTIPQTGWLDAMLDYHRATPRAGVVGAKLLYPNRTIQHAGMAICQDRMPRHLYLGFAEDHPAVNKSRRFASVTGACMLLRRERFLQLKGFDTEYVNGYEDVDLCLRLREQGLEAHYCHDAVLFHLESKSPNRFKYESRNAQRYFGKWGERVERDDLRYYLDDGLLQVQYHIDYMEVRLSSQLGFAIEAPLTAEASVGDSAHSRPPAIAGEANVEAIAANNALAAGVPRRPFGVNLVGHFQSEKGVGEGARAMARALEAAGIPHFLYNMVDPGSANREMKQEDFRQENPYSINLLHLNADELPHFADSVDDNFFRGRYNVGFWNWELSTFPAEWMTSFRLLDEVWTPSTFTRDSVATLAPVPVRCIPYCLELPRPTRLNRQHFGLPANSFLFLFAFDLHSYIARKNPLAVVEAFQRAFGDRTDVGLVFKTSHAPPEGTRADDHHRLQDVIRNQPNFHLIDGILSREEMLALVELCDAYASLHRSEGFGFPLAEAMALGKPVIATNYSSNVDFMHEDNSLPVRYQMLELTESHGPYPRGAEWADPDVDHAAECMRRVVEDRAAAERIGRRARDYIAQYHSAAAVGQELKAAVNELSGKPARATVILRHRTKFDMQEKLRSLQDVAHYPFQSHRGRIGRIIVMIKRALARMLRPVFERQSACNMLLIDALARVNHKVRDQELAIDELRAQLQSFSAAEQTPRPYAKAG